MSLTTSPSTSADSIGGLEPDRAANFVLSRSKCNCEPFYRISLCIEQVIVPAFKTKKDALEWLETNCGGDEPRREKAMANQVGVEKMAKFCIQSLKFTINSKLKLNFSFGTTMPFRWILSARIAVITLEPHSSSVPLQVPSSIARDTIAKGVFECGIECGQLWR